jgi:prepilin-type N-terminal cleavage/methylation domain-containing protein
MRRREEAGFTLVEMVVVVVVLGMISFGLLSVFIQGLNLTASAGTSLGSTHDTQLTDFYLERDALGGTASYPGSATTPGSDTPPTWGCAAGAGISVGGSGSPDQGVIQFNWAQADAYSGSNLPSGQPSFGSGLSYESDYVYEGNKLVR